MLVETMASINNHFALNRTTGELFGAEDGYFNLINGKIEVDGHYVVGQYIGVSGSILNNGIYRVEGFTDGVISLIQNVADYPMWIRPTTALDAPNTGDRVRHNNLRWVSLQDANIVEPGWPGSTGTWWSLVYGAEIQNPFADEEFYGTIYSLRIPNEFLNLVEEIKQFTQTKAGEASNITSSSFGIQSVSFGVNASGVKAGWQDVFRQSLHKYRRMTPDITL